jgi:hypothetical protein
VQQRRKEVVGVYYRFRNVQIEGREEKISLVLGFQERKEKNGKYDR